MKAFDNYINAIAIELSEVYWKEIGGSYCYKIKDDDDPSFKEWLIKKGLAFEMEIEKYVSIDHKKAVLYILKHVHEYEYGFSNGKNDMTFEQFMSNPDLKTDGEIDEKKCIEFVIDLHALLDNGSVIEYRKRWREMWKV